MRINAKISRAFDVNENFCKNTFNYIESTSKTNLNKPNLTVAATVCFFVSYIIVLSYKINSIIVLCMRIDVKKCPPFMEDNVLQMSSISIMEFEWQPCILLNVCYKPKKIREGAHLSIITKDEQVSSLHSPPLLMNILKKMGSMGVDLGAP